jgi:RecA/RadA recombinase
MARKPHASPVVTSAPAQNRERLKGMAEVAQAFKAFRPAPEVVQQVEAVPTIFPDLDRVIGVGGLPSRRITVVHGPSNKGKSQLTLGLGLSFLKRDHFFGLCDAEQTSGEDWVRKMFGKAFEHPGFVSIPVGTFEQTRDGFRDYYDQVARARAAGNIPEDTRAMGLIDSITKLVPAKLWEELQKASKADKQDADAKPKKGRAAQRDKSKGVDGASGRAGQLKAGMISAFMDEMVPVLAQTKGTLVLITRENVEVSEDFFGGEIITLVGGKALNFDASLRLRVNAFPTYTGEGKEREFVGEKHVVEVLKTKVAGKGEQVPRALFHTNADGTFDSARDLLTCALELGVVTVRGSYYVGPMGNLGQGMEQALTAIRSSEVTSTVIEKDCREKMAAASSRV